MWILCTQEQPGMLARYVTKRAKEDNQEKDLQEVLEEFIVEVEVLTC